MTPEKLHGERSGGQPLFFATVLLAPSLLGLIFADVILKIPKRRELFEVKSVDPDNFGEPSYNEKTREVHVTKGDSTYIELEDGIRIMVHDFRKRPERNHRGGAMIVYGGRLVRKRVNSIWREALDGGKTVHLDERGKTVTLGKTGIQAKFFIQEKR